MKLNRKLILISILTTFIVVFLFSVYGERQAFKFDKLVKIEQCSDNSMDASKKSYKTQKIIGTRFEDDFFSITLPPGWNVSRENKTVVLTKDDNVFMTITIFEFPSNLVDANMKMKSQIQSKGDVSIEDIVIGTNTFTKATSSMGVTDSATLYSVTTKGLLTIVAGMFNEPEVLVILGSLNLK